VVPAAAVPYLLSPEVGELPGGGDEDAISMAKEDDAGNSVYLLALCFINQLFS
jgi:hypothetical protein